MIRMTDEEWAELERLAQSQRRTRSGHIRFLLEQDLKEKAAA